MRVLQTEWEGAPLVNMEAYNGSDCKLPAGMKGTIIAMRRVTFLWFFSRWIFLIAGDDGHPYMATEAEMLALCETTPVARSLPRRTLYPAK